MRIVVSGTHASGKSTLVSDFAIAHTGYTVLGDPYDDLLDDIDGSDPRVFLAQLRVSAARLADDGSSELIAERGPLDFLAYLLAWQELGRGEIGTGLLERCEAIASHAMREVDLLVLMRAPDIHLPADEDPELRDAMGDALSALCDDPELTGGARVLPLEGAPAERLAGLERLVHEQW